MKPGVASMQAARLSPEILVIVVHEDKRVYACESRRCVPAGRLWSWKRQGERIGHHRGLRVGHAYTGVVWELERTAISLHSSNRTRQPV